MAYIRNKKVLFSAKIVEGSNVGTKTITENGTYKASDDNLDGYSEVRVEVVGGGSSEDMLQQRVDYGENCDYLFYQYPGTTLDYINNLDTSKAKSMFNTFSSCNVTNLDVSHFNTSNVTSLSNTFLNSKCQTINASNWDTSKVRLMDRIFESCTELISLDVSNWDMQSIEAASFYTPSFKGCSKLTSLDLSTWKNTSNLIGLDSTFASCSKLVTLNLTNWDTHNVTDWDYTFNYSTVLKEILGVLDMYSRTTTSDFLSSCRNIETLTLKNIRIATKIGSGTSWGHKLSVDSLVNAIKELWDYSSETTTYKLTMGSANTAKLTDIYVRLITPTTEQIEADPYIESKMPCEVCESTDEGAMLITDYVNLKSWELA